ncbi:MAG: hypothetical protein EOO28_20420 [Comamonadaceae bacterium]|nr:MAG: hypothetical protein EOO28_20420 [Comamonadaceae bacterium]
MAKKKFKKWTVVPTRKKRGSYEGLGLQTGNIIESMPTTSFGGAVGAALGSGHAGNLRVSYEQAACTCGGENANCFKCDGTGFYTKQMVQDPSKLPPDPPNSRLRTKNQTPTESTFSNDSRGGDYGIREQGRYGSNPLYDDHE